MTEPLLLPAEYIFILGYQTNTTSKVCLAFWQAKNWWISSSLCSNYKLLFMFCPGTSDRAFIRFFEFFFKTFWVCRGGFIFACTFSNGIFVFLIVFFVPFLLFSITSVFSSIWPKPDVPKIANGGAQPAWNQLGNVQFCAASWTIKR